MKQARSEAKRLRQQAKEVRRAGKQQRTKRTKGGTYSSETVAFEILEHAGHTLRLRVQTTAERMRLRTFLREPWTACWITEHIRPGDVFYDIGANVGAFSLLAAKAGHGRVRVMAFEPSFATFASLCVNVIANDLQDSVWPFPILLTDRTALTTFNYRSLLAGAGLHAVGGLAPGKCGEECQTTPPYVQPVPGFRLDEFVERFALPSPTLVKLDVDGTESAVLQGMAGLLVCPALRSLLVEMNPGKDAGATTLEAMLAAFEFEPLASYRKLGKDGTEQTTYYALFGRRSCRGQCS